MKISKEQFNSLMSDIHDSVVRNIPGSAGVILDSGSISTGELHISAGSRYEALSRFVVEFTVHIPKDIMEPTDPLSFETSTLY